MGRLLFLVQTQMPPYSRHAVLEGARYSARYHVCLSIAGVWAMI